ncbi:hypothetical protein EV179_003831 [Coemansia sp. RSA 487]|nr:hypothetical protein LPJ74_003679 [Coemansia sp. RSA 1843]KAJ2213413.1 hypothetical protein EV179_003831 [Coemansia sp. RSA 487]
MACLGVYMEPSDIVLLVLGVFCPPGSVALKRGLNRDFIMCVGLTLLFWIPGVAFSWYLVFKYPLENFRRHNQAGQYHTIEEGLRRHSLNSAIASDEDRACRSEDDESRSNTLAPDTTANPPSRKSRSDRSKRSSQRSSRKSRSQSNASGSGRPSRALHDAARNYALRHQQRQQTHPVKKWFVDRFYFADPTQMPPSLESNPNELQELDGSQ